MSVFPLPPLNAPKRIQRKRTRGWRMPEGAVYVGRPTKWGNPFNATDAVEWEFASDEAQARALVVEGFADWLRRGPQSQWWFENGKDAFVEIHARIETLRGKDLACWCPLDAPCHADVLLEIANRPAPSLPTNRNTHE